MRKRITVDYNKPNPRRPGKIIKAETVDDLFRDPQELRINFRVKRDEEAIKRYNKGKTIFDISQALGVGETTVWRILHRNKVNVRPKGTLGSLNPNSSNNITT